MKKKVTIQDIADELGISRNTVSKAINNSGGLAPATREKIIQKAMEMDYKQFSYVKSLAGITSSGIDSNTSATEYQGEIALLTGQFFNQSHFASLMLDKFQEELSSLGFTMNIHRVTERNMSVRRLIRRRGSAIAWSRRGIWATAPRARPLRACRAPIRAWRIVMRRRRR